MNPSYLLLAVLVAALAVALLVGLRVLRRRTTGVPADVELRWTKHARERMAQRGVSAERVEATLRRPSARHHDEVERSWRFERTFGDELVKVWVSADPWPPRGHVVVKSTAARRSAQFRVPRNAVGRVIGRRGANVERIRRESAATVDVGADGTITVTADTREQVVRAKALVRAAARR